MLSNLTLKFVLTFILQTIVKFSLGMGVRGAPSRYVLGIEESHGEKFSDFTSYLRFKFPLRNFA